MISFPAFAGKFEIYPKEGKAYDHLSSLFEKVQRVDYSLCCVDPSINQGQLASDFDGKLETVLHSYGAAPYSLSLPPEIPQEYDFAFSYSGKKVAVEIEKANREKFLRDILKCHMYLKSGADLGVVVLLKNYPHKVGTWDLFDFGVQRFNECRKYGFGTKDMLDRILLLGFEQCDGATGKPISRASRLEMRVKSKAGPEK